eukprot:183108-Rhodomonas_salina.1
MNNANNTGWKIFAHLVINCEGSTRLFDREAHFGSACAVCKRKPEIQGLLTTSSDGVYCY